MKKILIANVGSTSYKNKLFQISDSGECVELFKSGAERVVDFESAIRESLCELENSGFALSEIDAVAFKTVLGKDKSGLLEADDSVLKALEDMSFVAPAHNPPYAAAIRAFAKILPNSRRIVLFETSFYRWSQPEWQRYAVPQTWHDAGIRRNGFHGASHKYAAERAAELCGRNDAALSAKMLYVRNGRAILEKPFRLVNCHIGGSSSVCGILNGAAIGASMGFSPQSGLPQNNRVGDLDSMAIPYAMHTLGIDATEALRQLSKEGGLFGISGVSNDARDIEEAAANGNERASLALSVLAYSTRGYIGNFAAHLGGLDAISFSGGIGENSAKTRLDILKPLEFMGVKIDSDKNSACVGKCEGIISADDSKIKVAVICANEEIVIAREAAKYLNNK